MEALHATYVILFAVAGFACLGSLIHVRHLSSHEVRWGLGGLLVLSAAWAFTYTVQLLVSSVALKEATYTVGLVFGFATPFVWLYFASAYAGRGLHRDRTLLLGATAVYGLAVLIKITNPLHGLYFTGELVTDPFVHMEITHGSIHWVLVGVSYALAGFGFWILFDRFRGQETPVGLYLLVGATALPALPLILSQQVPTLFLEINYEPLGVAVFAVGALFFLQDAFLELSSPGRTHLSDSLSEGVIFLDTTDVIVGFNDAAAASFPSLEDDLTTLDELNERVAELETGSQRLIQVPGGTHTQYVQARRQRIDIGPGFIDAAITLTDVTDLVELEELTRLKSKINESIIEAETVETVIERVCETISQHDPYRFVWAADRESRQVVTVAGDPGTYLSSLFDTEEVVAGTEFEPVNDDPVVESVFGDDGTTVLSRPAGERSDSDWQKRAIELSITGCLRISLDTGSDNGIRLGVYTTAPDGFGGREQELFCEVRDTLEHALAAIESRERAKRFEEAVNRAGYGLFITDTEGIVEYVNPAFEANTGYLSEDVINEHVSVLTDSSDTLTAAVATATEGAVDSQEVRNRRPNGERYWARRTVAPVTSGQDEVVGVVGIEVDITEQRIREQRLTVLNRVLRHNLRNQVNVILAQTSLLDSEFDSTETEPPGHGTIAVSQEQHGRSERTDTIREAAHELITLSEKARTIEQFVERATNDEHVCPLTVVIESVLSETRDENYEKAVDVTTPDEEFTVPDALEPALIELVVNALELQADVHVDITAEENSDGHQQLTITVADDGPGLPSHERQVLEEGDESALEHGSGLGLWLVNWLVVQSGGDLTIETTDGGTTITVTVPAERAPSSSDQ